MAESITHLRLVESLVAHISAQYAGVALFHDLPSLLGAEKPPCLGGYRPDVYAKDVPTTITVVGEAKTENDLVTEHSREQLTAFLRHLASCQRGVLVLAVPWPARATAQNLVSRLQRQIGCMQVATLVLDGIRPEAQCSK
jgi:type IV pilus biogenesis protein CpaD/CtpE